MSKMRASILLLAAASFFCTLATHAPFVDPGIGLSLSPGYGYERRNKDPFVQALTVFVRTISAHFRNGTSINIAKIEGSASYKAFMRKITNDSSHTTTSQPQLPSIWSLTSCPLQDRFCRYWPDHGKWNNALYPMLAALRTAAEATLEQPVEELMLSYSGTREYGVFVAELESALKNAGLKAIHSIPKFNGMMAGYLLAPAADARSDCRRQILTVENTRMALIATLWEDDCGMYDYWRNLYSFDLGRDSLQACFAQGRDDCDGQLRSALQDITRSPWRHPYGVSYPVVIEAVVMLGEAGADARMHAVLREVLKDQAGGSDLAAQEHKAGADLAFAASLGAATYASSIDWFQWPEHC